MMFRKLSSFLSGIRPSSKAVLLCPVCGQDVDGFLPLNPMYEQNKTRYGNPYTFEDVETINPKAYTCPRCGASDRDRLYALYLERLLSGSGVVSLLDIAPSKALQEYLSRFSLRYVSADRYMEGVDLVLDITDMSAIPSDSFDVFICSHVLEHVADDRRALAELYRVLRPGGSGILMVPINLKIAQIDEDPSVTDIAERWRRFGQDDHIRLYSKKGFRERIEAAGFILHEYGRQHFGAETFERHGISPGSVLYIGEKR